ncbi:NAD-dependent epimerase/dehydratase family protein [Jeotgalibacillus salarius]|uniref:NAD-dependent epimerase/dehydratase family protein n=1 Tax=Jeotgalibacillus salarius TaxID=546023 RepID=A0A4Y8LLW0_9BACL|nr:NAD-dependent epimerase/dehydratase family protein [Jeotgalibacillus salarius]
MNEGVINLRVLVTGGYGFIGSHTAEKFYREGHDVTIIDNLSTGSKKNVSFKHKFYEMDVTDHACDKVFDSRKFDAVVHLAAQVDVGVSMKDPYKDSESNVLGLANILQLSHKHGVKKVFFASSAAVYGLNEQIPLQESETCDPISTYGMNKHVGEMYCNKWGSIYDLDTVTFRFSNVYGPRQGMTGEGGVVSKFIIQALQHEPLTVFGDGEQTRDFIYVEDVAEAILKAMESPVTGIYNLSANTQTSVNNLIDELNKYSDLEDVVYTDEAPGDIKHSRLDNTRVKKDLDWVPLNTFGEGFEKTFEWFKENTEFKREKKKAAIPFSEKINRFGSGLPYAENLLLFALAITASVFLQDTFFMVDFILFYIVIAASLFGRNQSLISVGLGLSWFLFVNISNGREPISMLVDMNALILMGLYVFVGLTLSYVLDRKEKAIQYTQEEYRTLDEKYGSLHEVYKDTLHVKNELQEQVLYTNNSYGNVYEIVRELDSLDEEELQEASVKMVEKLMNRGEAALFKTNYDGSMSAVAKSDLLIVQDTLSLPEEAKNQIYAGKVFVNKNFNAMLPSMLAPLYIEGKVYGVMGVYHLPFEKCTLFYQNLLSIALKMVASAIGKALLYKSSEESQRYIDGTSVLRPGYFIELLENRERVANPFQAPQTLITVVHNNIELEELAKVFEPALEENEFMGLDQDGHLCFLIFNDQENKVEHFLQLLENSGFELNVTQEEKYYG